MRRALFLDRDGVVNIEKKYVFHIEDFEFIDGIFDLCLQFQTAGYLLFIVTNQAGIARGYYTESDYQHLTDWMLFELKKRGIHIAKVYHCPHHPDFTGKCECRKPNPGMILKARDEFSLDLAESILIGDKQSDIESGIQAKISTNLLFNYSQNSISDLMKNLKVNNLKPIVK